LDFGQGNIRPVQLGSSILGFSGPRSGPIDTSKRLGPRRSGLLIFQIEDPNFSSPTKDAHKTVLENGTIISNIGPNYRTHAWVEGGDYIQPYARFHSYGVGILIGWLIKYYRINKPEKSIGLYIVYGCLWFTSLLLMFVTYYAAAIWHTPTIGPTENTDVWLPDYSTVVISTRGGAAVWNSLFRTFWSLGLGLMIFLCDQGRVV